MWRALILLPLMAAPAGAQEMPACTPAREGAVACLAQKLCACRVTRGGSVSGLRDGARWDCGVLRPACGEVPADLHPPPTPPQIILQPHFTPQQRPAK